MKDILFFLKTLIYNWLYCIFNPYKSCKNLVIEKQISDIEKIQYAFGIWLAAFILTVSLEVPIFSFFQVEWSNPKFYIPYFCIGFIYLILASTVLHIGLLIFRIKSKLTDTFLIYSILFGSFSPFILLGMYPLIIRNYYLLQTFKAHDYNLIYLHKNFIEINNNIDKIFMISITVPVSYIFSNILSCSLGVLLCLTVIERYNSPKIKTFLCITFSQTVLLVPPLLLIKIVEYFIILQSLKIN